MADNLSIDSQLVVDRHVKSFMTALGLHAAVNTTGIGENRAAFLEAANRVEHAVRQAFSAQPVIEALTAFDELIIKTRINVDSTEGRSHLSRVSRMDPERSGEGGRRV